MLDLLARRPSASRPAPDQPRLPGEGGPPVSARRWAGRWAEAAVARVRSAAGALAPPGGADELAAIVAEAREPDEIRMALVRLAGKVAVGARVELVREREGRPSRRLASWPPPPPGPLVQAGAPPRGPASDLLAPAGRRGVAPSVLQVPLRAGESGFGTLRLTACRTRPWPASVVRRLGTLCAMAAAAERGLALAPRAEAGTGPLVDPDGTPRGTTMLGAFLGFAQAQARRRVEPLSLLDVAVDRLSALRELLGDELAESALDRSCRAIRATVRASDVVVRLEDGRLAVILPNASSDNAAKVAEAVRAAIARAGAASATMPTLTASIGVANYPDHAHDVGSLRAAASAALTRAKAMGYDRVARPAPG